MIDNLLEKIETLFLHHEKIIKKEPQIEKTHNNEEETSNKTEQIFINPDVPNLEMHAITYQNTNIKRSTSVITHPYLSATYTYPEMFLSQYGTKREKKEKNTITLNLFENQINNEYITIDDIINAFANFFKYKKEYILFKEAIEDIATLYIQNEQYIIYSAYSNEYTNKIITANENHIKELQRIKEIKKIFTTKIGFINLAPITGEEILKMIQEYESNQILFKSEFVHSLKVPTLSFGEKIEIQKSLNNKLKILENTLKSFNQT